VADLRRDLLARTKAQATNPPEPAVPRAQDQASRQTAAPARARPATQIPAPALASPPRRSSSALLMIVVLAVLGVVGLGGLALSALVRQPGGAGRREPTPAPQPTAAPAAQEWLLPGASGRLAFGQSPDQSGYDLFATALDGTVRQITGDRASISPAWSPDGKRIAITHATGASRGIFVADLDALTFEQVSPGDQEARYPAWSPDGQQIAFAMRPNTSAAWQLAIVRLPGREVTATGVSGVAWISWSRQGTLAYSALVPGASQQDIITLEAGGAPRNLTNSPDAEEDFPAWSPSGDRIAFVASPPGQENLSQRQIFAIGADGGNLTQLTSGPGPHTNPVWSPDGQWLAYLSQQAGGDWQVWALRADGSEPRQNSFSPERKFYRARGEKLSSRGSRRPEGLG
jgi:Tol biopolymer transport system component